MPRNYYSNWYASKPTIKADGIKTKTARGEISQTWWGKRFVSILEGFGLGARLDRGRRYARQGQVLSVEVSSGTVSATVQGSSSKPYKVSITIHSLAEKSWKQVEAKLVEKAKYLAKLLSGDMPSDIDEAFLDVNLSLFPERQSDLVTECSCPDYSNPCKHIAAVVYIFSEMLDDDPFLMFKWRGRDKSTLLSNLRVLKGKNEENSKSNTTNWLKALESITVPNIDKPANLQFWGDEEKIHYQPKPLTHKPHPLAIFNEGELPPISILGKNLTEYLVPAYDFFINIYEALSNDD